MRFIDIQRQYQLYRGEVNRAIRQVLESGSFILGPQVEELEAVLANYVGVEHCVGVSSGTDALLIALMALDIGPGDEVITTPFTWISTVEVIQLVGATPVFVDIDLDTFCLDADRVEEAVTGRTKAIIPVNLFGQMADFRKINALAEKHGFEVIEDGAQSFGAMQNGKRSCSMSRIGETSFFPAKPFGCYGDGGALFTNDAILAEQMRAIRSHGGIKRGHHTHLGINGRLDTLQAAIMLAKWPHFEKELRIREQIGKRYTEQFFDGCVVPEVAEGNTHIYAQYTLRVKERDAFAAELHEKGIPTAVYYSKCLHQQPVFAYLGYRSGSFPFAEQAAREVISLPLHPWMTEEELELVVESVTEVLERMDEEAKIQL